MSPTEPVCPRCGSALPAADVVCPRCALELAVAPPAAGEDDPPTSHPQLRMVPPDVEDLRALFPELELEGLIGRGGMGAVYRARQKRLQRDVALKVLPRELSADRAFAERFLREARALARLSHPNIVAVHDYGETAGFCWLMLELVEGANLREVLRSGAIDSRQALTIVRELCEALQYAHDEGVVHRDIKPENVLVDRRGRVRVADFGLAKIVGAAGDASLTREGQVMGTPHYMAPEQIERPREVDHRADIYALGVVLYEMLTGSLPRGNFEPPSRRVHVDVKLDEIVLKALEHEPSRRYQHAVDVKTDVDAVGEGARVAPRAFGVRAGIDERGPFAESLAGNGAKARAGSRPRDLLRGFPGIVFDVALWIGIAGSWNLGPGPFAGAVVIAIGLYALRIRLRLRETPELAAALAAERRGPRILRGSSAVLGALIGFACVVQGHVAWWELGVPTWAPAYRGPDGLIEHLRANVWTLVPPELAQDPATTPRLDLASSRATLTLGEIAPVRALIVLASGLVVLMLAVLAAIHPSDARGPRKTAWLVASDLSGRFALALGILWLVGAAIAARDDVRLESLTRTFRVAAPLDEVVERMRRRIGERTRDVEQRAVVVDARTGARYAEVQTMRTGGISPFDDWRMTWTGPVRWSPQGWAWASRVAGADATEVTLHYGLHDPDDRTARYRRESLEMLERAIGSPPAAKR